LLSIAWIFTFPAVNAVAVSNICRQRRRLQKPVVRWKHPSASRDYLFQVANRMASVDDKPQETATPSASTVLGNETSRAKSIATRLTDAEFSAVEAAAADAGKKVAEWLREAALAHARASAGAVEQTDPILLAEIMGMRSLMLNLFARASEGPLTTEDLRKMSAHSDSIKEQRAQDYMAQRRRRISPKTTDKP
jgi:uncharacterized protein (DUF1778 family)